MNLCSVSPEESACRRRFRPKIGAASGESSCRCGVFSVPPCSNEGSAEDSQRHELIFIQRASWIAGSVLSLLQPCFDSASAEPRVRLRQLRLRERFSWIL